MSHSIMVSALLRSFTRAGRSEPAALPSPPSPTADHWSLLLAAVEQQLRERPMLLAENAEALRCLHGMLATERAAMTDSSLHLETAQRLLAETREALAASRLRERQAAHRAMHDSLTALPNRASFRGRLDDELARAGHPGAVAVLVLDLDGFKPVNDEHGHHCGDELLKVVAARLARAVRSSDQVARLGGDEFGCLLTCMPGRDRLRRLADTLHNTISAPIALGPLRLSVRPSIGIALHDGSADGDALIRRADAAMYVAKRSRSGHAFCDAVS
jgi:diguanylate cyclase (GGDEF)-like protein